MVVKAAAIKNDEDALNQMCGGDKQVELVKTVWADMLEKKRLDCSNLGLGDEGCEQMLKGLHMCAGSSTMT